MAAEEFTAEDDALGSAPGGGGGKKKLLLIIAPLALLLIGGVAAYGLGLFGGIAGGAQPAEGEAPTEAAPEETTGFFYELPPMLVNLSSTGRKTSFLKITVALEVGSEADVPEIEAAMPRIIDNFQVYLRELRVEDLRGSQGIYRLREELLRRVNAAALHTEVRDILFKEMLVQ